MIRQRFHEFRPRQRRIVQVHAVHVIRLPCRSRADQRGFSGAGVADEQGDPLPARNAVVQDAQRFLVRFRQHQKLWIRCEVERARLEAKERSLHQRTSPASKFRRQATTTAARTAPAADSEMASMRVRYLIRRRSSADVITGMIASTGNARLVTTSLSVL